MYVRLASAVGTPSLMDASTPCQVGRRQDIGQRVGPRHFVFFFFFFLLDGSMLHVMVV